MAKFSDRLLEYFIERESKIGIKISKFLGADVNAQNKDGGTALMEAACWGNTELAEALIKAGANVNAQSENGQTALMWAVYSYRGHTAVVEALIKAGTDVNVQNKYGKTALMWAASDGNTELAEALIKAGADVSLKDEHDMTALDIAQIKRQTEVESLLKFAEQQNSDLNNTLQQSEQNSTYEVTDKPKDNVSITITNAMFNKRAGR